MMDAIKLKSRTIIGIVALLLSYTVYSQNTDALSIYSPYSLFGLGQIEPLGSAYNMSMGGIGIGLRDNRFINYTNPAAITERDTLSFMFDFGAVEKNMYATDRNANSAYNVFNMQNIALTVPIWRKSAFIVGIQPFSNVGYKFLDVEKDEDIISQVGDVKYQKYGTGSMYQLFFGAGATFWNRLSIGAQAFYYFGYIDRHSNALFSSLVSYNDTYTGWNYKLHCFSGKFGIQYVQPFKSSNTELTFGATYNIGNKLNGEILRYAYTNSNTGIIDTAFHYNRNDLNLHIADELGLGVSFRKKDKWMLGFDYIQQNWNRNPFEIESTDLTYNTSTARYYKLGFEIIPNKYDIRYYMKRVSYRLGAYYEQSYVRINGHQVNSFGITLGASLPILKLHNAITVAVNMGQRGTLKYNQVRERYVNFMIGINLHDIWFVKYKYD